MDGILYSGDMAVREGLSFLLEGGSFGLSQRWVRRRLLCRYRRSLRLGDGLERYRIGREAAEVYEDFL